MTSRAPTSTGSLVNWWVTSLPIVAVRKNAWISRPTSFSVRAPSLVCGVAVAPYAIAFSQSTRTDFESPRPCLRPMVALGCLRDWGKFSWVGSDRPRFWRR